MSIYSSTLLGEARNIENYFDFSSGVPIEEQRIKHWIAQVITKLTDEGFCHSSVACGNSVVIGVKYEDEIEIFVATKYKSFTLYPSEEERREQNDTI